MGGGGGGASRQGMVRGWQTLGVPVGHILAVHVLSPGWAGVYCVCVPPPSWVVENQTGADKGLPPGRGGHAWPLMCLRRNRGP